MDWFLYDRDFNLERINPFVPNVPFLSTLGFSDVFRGYRNVTLGTNGLINL